MNDYKIKFPQGIYNISASNRKDAIEEAVGLFKKEFEGFVDSGEVYLVPEICVNKETGSFYDEKKDQPSLF